MPYPYKTGMAEHALKKRRINSIPERVSSFHLPSLTVIFNRKSDGSFIHMYDPVVTDRDSVCIFSQIVDYGLCTLKSFFAVRDPFCRIAGIQKFLKYITISIFFRGSIEIQLVFFPKRFQLFQIFSTKNFWNNINCRKNSVPLSSNGFH